MKSCVGAIYTILSSKRRPGFSTHNITVTTRTLNRRINDWGIELIRNPTEDSEHLRSCIRLKFYDAALDDVEMLKAL